MNSQRSLYYVMVGLLVFSTIIAGCSAPAKLIYNTPFFQPIPSTFTADPTESPTALSPVFPTYTPSPPPTRSKPPAWTTTSTIIHSPTPTETWIYNKAGMIVAPILLYHHISDTVTTNRYYVTVENFRVQMQALAEWGYTSITPTYFRKVLVDGGNLPIRPVLITFDDGDLDVYQNAFPIMRKYGFVGTFYLVTSMMGAEGYVGVEQLKEMVAAGWEIGSHTTDHIDLTTNHDQARKEMLQSRLDIEEALSVTVTSIAYPYGLVDSFIATKAQEYGYFTGMGLGILTEHTWGSMYYLNRREVHGDMDRNAFASLLPWSGPLITSTPIPETLIPPK